MAAATDWRQPAPPLDGPFPISSSDIADVNRVFSDSFTERYHRDGLVGVRVPHLSQSVWRYAIADANGGAMLWRGSGGEVVAFNVAHRSGTEGWMGPLAVANGHQAAVIGKTIVRSAMEWLRARGAKVIGLETMPRTMDNIGFYSRLGFAPGKLTLTVTVDAEPGERQMTLLSRMNRVDQDDSVKRCAALTNSLIPGYDFSREILLTEELHLGDTLMLSRLSELRAFAVCHSVPLVEGRARDELRVLKLVCASSDDFVALVKGIADHARRCGAHRAAIRVQSDYLDFYRTIIGMGGKVRWTDLRMTAPDHAEIPSSHGAVLSNWEI